MKEVKMKTEDETQTFCEYICITNHRMFYAGSTLFVTYQDGVSYWFHEDQPVHKSYFLPVIDSDGFPVTKTCRIDK